MRAKKQVKSYWQCHKVAQLGHIEFLDVFQGGDNKHIPPCYLSICEMSHLDKFDFLRSMWPYVVYGYNIDFKHRKLGDK